VSTNIVTEFEIGGTPQDAFGLLCDRDFALQRVAAPGMPTSELLQHELADGVLTVGSRMAIARKDLPRAVRGFVRGEPGAARTETWRTEGQGYRAQVRIVLEGAPSTIAGTIDLRPSAAAGTSFAVNLDVHVPLPMVGKDVEAVVVDNIRTSLIAEAALFTERSGGVGRTVVEPETRQELPEESVIRPPDGVAEMTRNGDGLQWGEGPRWREGQLWVSDTRGSKLWVGQNGAWKNYPLDSPCNGLWFLPDGRLVAALISEARIGVWDGARFDTYADLSGLEPGPLGDLVGDEHGNLYVDDVAYSMPDGEAQKAGRLLRITPDGQASVVAEDLVFPNGLAFLDGGRTLVVAETFAQRLTYFDVHDDGSISRRSELDLSDLGDFVGPDGLWTDGEDLWAATLSAQKLVLVRGGAIDRVLETPGVCPIAGWKAGDGTMYVTVAEPGDKHLFEAMSDNTVTAAVMAVRPPE
jgi:sugar lactone lactonase YvrE